jgi:hypothetical protein
MEKEAACSLEATGLEFANGDTFLCSGLMQLRQNLDSMNDVLK